MVLQSLRKAFERVRSFFASGSVSQGGDSADARYQVVEQVWSHGYTCYKVFDACKNNTIHGYNSPPLTKWRAKSMAEQDCKYMNLPAPTVVSERVIYP